MRLGAEDRWVDLELVGYESPELVRSNVDDDDPDGHWLILHAQVAGKPGVSYYGDLSLTVEELGQLASWFTVVASGDIGEPSSWNRAGMAFEAKSVVAFMEPDVAMRITTRDGDDINLRWYFEDAASTEDLSDDAVFAYDFMSYKATSVNVVTSPRQMRAAAEGLSGAMSALADSFAT